MVAETIVFDEAGQPGLLSIQGEDSWSLSCGLRHLMERDNVGELGFGGAIEDLGNWVLEEERGLW